MSTLTNRLFPSAVNMIRLDHTHVLATFHQYDCDTAPTVKVGLVKTACLALEVHAQLEEEIFYPALRSVFDDAAMQKAVPEHDQMKVVIGKLREMEPTDAQYDETFMQLMRDVIHHVADEETILLPKAEQLLADRLGDLGAAMTKRRMELMAPRSGEMAMNMARAMPASTMLMFAGAALSGAYLTTKYLRRRA